MIKKILMVLLCLTVALVSMFVVAKRATDPQSYKNTIQSIDDKKATVMGITTATITASTALAAIPTPLKGEFPKKHHLSRCSYLDLLLMI